MGGLKVLARGPDDGVDEDLPLAGGFRLLGSEAIEGLFVRGGHSIIGLARGGGFSIFRIMMEYENLNARGFDTPHNELEKGVENNETMKRISNGFYVSKNFHRFIQQNKILSTTLTLHLFLIVLYYEISFHAQYSKLSYILLYLIQVSSIFASLFFWLTHQKFNDLKESEASENEVKGKEVLISGIALILVQPLSFLEENNIENWNYIEQFVQPIKLNYILALASLLKLLILIPSFLNTLKFKNPRSSRVCKIYGCESSILYELKCYFKEEPIKLVVILIFCSIALFTFGFRICERSKSSKSSIFNYTENTVYLVIITMTSVGYGDYAPQTAFGRIVGVICTFWGVLTVSIMVLVVVNTFELDQRENKSLKILKKLEQKQRLKKVAQEFISYSLSRLWRNRKLEVKQVESHEQRNLKHELRELIRSSKFSDVSEMDLMEEMRIHFDRLNYGLENLDLNCSQFVNYLSNEYFIDISNIKKKDK